MPISTALTSGQAYEGTFFMRFCILRNQHLMRRLRAKAASIALMSRGAPSLVIVVGMHNPLFTISLMKESQSW